MTDVDAAAEVELVVPPPVELPEFEGVLPVGVDTVLTGTSQRISRPIHHGQRGVLVVEYEVADVRHPKTKDGLKRKQMLKAVDAYELPEPIGGRLLVRLKKAHRLATDKSPVIAGFEEADVDGGELTTDGNGVVLTGGDLEALGLADASNDPVVVVFDTDAPDALWPHEFDEKELERRPVPGEEFPSPAWAGGDEPMPSVVRLLDPDTGETVAGWSDEDWEANLEQRELDQAAAEDRDAADELEAARAKRAEPTEGQMVNRAPFDEYDKADVALIKLWLAEDCPSATEAEHVAVFEEAHKGRKSVIKAARERVAVFMNGDPL
jgi:hypothetical protein